MSKKPAHRRGRRSEWMQTHLDDPYVKQAQAEGWRSRAVYKLKEIDERDRLIRPGMRVLDLGAAPGGWSQYVTRKLQGRGTVVAMDILPMDALPDVTFIQGDFTEQAVADQVMAALDGQPVDLVISDMAPNLSGVKAADQPRAMYLAELALEMARDVLTKDGAFLIKVFQGEGFDEFFKEVKATFQSVKTRKPKASRPHSREVYVLAMGRRQ